MTPIPETCPKCGAAKKARVPMHGGPDVFDCGGKWLFDSGCTEIRTHLYVDEEVRHTVEVYYKQIAALRAKLSATEEGAKKEIEKAKEERLDELNLLESRWSMKAHELARERDEARKVARNLAAEITDIVEYERDPDRHKDLCMTLDALPTWVKEGK